MIGTGVAAALPFQRAVDRSGQTAIEPRETGVVWRRAEGGLEATAVRQAQAAELFIRQRNKKAARNESRARKPASLDAPSVPPKLPLAYEPLASGTAAAVTGQRKRSAESPAPESEPGPRAVLHQIVDGDTLERLAARYLGNGNRWLEIYAENHDLLENPDLLPIGAELVIAVRQEKFPHDRSDLTNDVLEMVPISSAQWTDLEKPD